jgi:hypothetical protein
MGQELGDPINGMAGNTAEDIIEPSEWINTRTLAASDKAAQHSSGLAAHIAAEEQPVARLARTKSYFCPLCVASPGEVALENCLIL